MINSEFIPPEELQVVNGSFTISSGSNDDSAFFNMGTMNNNRNRNSNPNEQQNEMVMGGFGSGMSSFFGANQKQADQMVTPNAPVQAPPSTSQSGQNCNGNCGACVWSFLCKSATKKLSSLGGNFVPKLG